MTSAVGKVTNVYSRPAGSNLVADALTGATVLYVENAYDFNETGGSLQLENGTVLQFTAADPATDTITLAAALTADLWSASAVDANDYFIAVAPATTELVANVIFTDDRDEGVLAIVPIERRNYFQEGIREPGLEESVTVSDDSGDWMIVGVDDQLPFDGSVITPGSTPPNPPPTSPPAVSPAIRAFGNSEGITVITEPIESTTVLDFYINGVLSIEATAVGTRSTVVNLRLDGHGDPFVAFRRDDAGNDVPVLYNIHCIARNVAGSAAPSDDVVASLNMGVSPEFVAARAALGFVLAGQIQVGNIIIDPDSGITIPLADGGSILFPADGSPARIDADLTTDKLDVNDNMTILGLANLLGGLLTLRSSWVAPKAGPKLTTSVAGPNAFTIVWPAGEAGQITTMWEQDATHWGIVASHTDPVDNTKYITRIYSVAKSTGAASILYTFPVPSGGNGFGAGFGDQVAVVGTKLYAASHEAVYPSDGTHFIDEWDMTTWTRTKHTALAWPTSQTWKTTWGRGVWCDGTNLFTTYCNYDTGLVYLQTRSISNPATVLATAAIPGSSSIFCYTSPFFVGQFDYGSGALRRLIISDNSRNRVYAVNAAGTSITENVDQKFQADNAGGIIAMTYSPTDGYFWYIVNVTGYDYSFRQFSKNITLVNGRSFTATYAKGAGPTPTYESKPSPAATVNQTARAWIIADGPAIPTVPDVNDPDRIGAYVGNQLQGFSSAGSRRFWFDTLASPAGRAAPTVEGFPASNPGTVASQALDSNGNAMLLLAGDGSFRLDPSLNKAKTLSYHATLRANQSIPAATVTWIAWNTTIYNSGDAAGNTANGITYNTTTREYTVPRAGLYMVNHKISFDAASGGVRLTYVFINGNRYHRFGGRVSNQFAGTEGGGCVVTCNAGDKISIGFYQTTTAALNVLGDTNDDTFVDITYLGSK